MRKLLSMACLVGLLSSSLWADEFSPHYPWIERVSGALVIPNSLDVSSNLNTGFAGDLSVGYRFLPNFSLSLSTGYYQYDLKNQPFGYSGNFSYVPLMGVFSLSITDENVRPYISVGAGFAFNLYTQNIPSGGDTIMVQEHETAFLLAPGGGVMVVLDPQFAFFVEGRVDLNFRSNGSLGMPSGNPSIFVPIQAGILFLVI